MYIRRRQRGVTFIELIIFIVVVAIGVAGILGAINMSVSSSADPLRRKQALLIAESLLEEVQLANFSLCDPTSDNADTAANAASCTIPENWGQSAPEPVGPRPFDNVNDYVAAAATPSSNLMSAGRVMDATGTPFPAGYAATIAIRPAALGGIGAAGAAADTEVLRITVTVTFGGDTLVLDGYRTRHAPRL